MERYGTNVNSLFARVLSRWFFSTLAQSRLKSCKALDEGGGIRLHICWIRYYHVPTWLCFHFFLERKSSWFTLCVAVYVSAVVLEAAITWPFPVDNLHSLSPLQGLHDRRSCLPLELSILTVSSQSRRYKEEQAAMRDWVFSTMTYWHLSYWFVFLRSGRCCFILHAEDKSGRMFLHFTASFPNSSCSSRTQTRSWRRHKSTNQ